MQVRRTQACSMPDGLPANRLRGHSEPEPVRWKLSESFRLSFRNRDGKVERCPFSELTVKPDTTALHFDQTLGDIQTQTCTWHFTGLHIIGTEEFLEDLILIFNANSYPIILHPKMDNPLCAFGIPLIVGGFCTQKNLATLGS